MEWKEIAEIIARERNKTSVGHASAYIQAIRLADPELYTELQKLFKFPGEIYPILSHIAEKYRLYLTEKAMNMDSTIPAVSNEKSVTEFKQSF